MEDLQPSTSKEARSSNPDDDKDDFDGASRDGAATNSESSRSLSSDHLNRSRMDLAAASPDLPKPSLGKPTAKRVEKKKPKKTSKIEKRKRPISRRQVIRRAPRRKPRARMNRKRDLSASTIYSRLTSSGILTPGCERCGHRCCRRSIIVRFEMELRRWKQLAKKGIRKISPKRKYNKSKRKTNCNIEISEAVQVGSRSIMLSPLLIDSSPMPVESAASAQDYSEITPEMIYETVKRLSMWRQNVETMAIHDHISRDYPVNPDKEASFAELLEKLRIAAIVGFICQTSDDTWSLCGYLERRKLATSHVSLFWKIYTDTMKPISRNLTVNSD
ncbi:uncharacterized protein LOC126972094 [Leptidea sinapis]|uniref:uncharacterized protein LOC126972094 n=1 Tax=Leptidea sinapis TaxID=189913 RepID=UPI0021C268BD|nr:uncharacterized protein LOC126972094 [Leptidea sinapis]